MVKNRVKPLIGAGLSKGSFISCAYVTAVCATQPSVATPVMQIIRQ